MKNYRKIIAFVIGAAILVASKYFNVTVPGLDSLGLELIILGLTGLGVYQVRNEA